MKVHWKIRLLRGGFTKNQYRAGELPERGRGEGGQFVDLRGNLARKRRGGFWDGGVDTPMHTMIQGVQTPVFFWYSPNCALKFWSQFRRNTLKNQFQKRKNTSKRSTNSILSKFFNAILRNILSAELIFEKLYLILKLKFRIFNSMAVILYLHILFSGHSQSLIPQFS